MTGLVTSGEKRLVLVSGRAHIELAQQVGESWVAESLRQPRMTSPVEAPTFVLTNQYVVRMSSSCNRIPVK